ncbi:MAG: HPr family phosphocarrier protein [Pirellulales bacterium]|nr:HPr family phosphocarrier protein [Pirellulales bacterium]
MSEPVYSKQVIVTSPNGLHLRPLEMLVTLSRQFKSKIEIIKDTERIDGKSMMESLALISGQGTQLTIETSGSDAEEALDSLVQLFAGNFEEPPVEPFEPPAC